jgi:hypothetical protein
MPPHHVTKWNSSAFESLSNVMPIQLDHFSVEPLAEYHVDWYLSVQSLRFSRLSMRGFMARVARKYFSNLIRKSDSIRREITGHTLYVLMRKV